MPPPARLDRKSARNLLLVNAVTRPVNLIAGLVALIVVAAAAGGVGVLAGLLVLAGMSARTFFDEDEAEQVFRDHREQRQGAADGAPPAAPAGVRQRILNAAAPTAAALPPAAQRIDPSTMPEQFAVHLRSAHRTEQSVRDALAQTGKEFSGLGKELSLIIDDMEKTAARANMVNTYVRGQNPSHLQAELNALRTTSGSPARIEQLNDQLKSLYRLQRKVEDYVHQLSSLTGALSTVATKVVELALIGDESGSTDLLAQARGLREQVEELQNILRDPAV